MTRTREPSTNPTREEVDRVLAESEYPKTVRWCRWLARVVIGGCLGLIGLTLIRLAVWIVEFLWRML